MFVPKIKKIKQLEKKKVRKSKAELLALQLPHKSA